MYTLTVSESWLLFLLIHSCNIDRSFITDEHFTPLLLSVSCVRGSRNGVWESVVFLCFADESMTLI